MDTIADSVDNHYAHNSQYNCIKDFVIYFEKVIYDFEVLAKMDYILLMDRRFKECNSSFRKFYEDCHSSS
ncbi:hypothetical protein C2G38_2195516 [Gigaspora rosea]|uniref:Uncharacterized protein n=1 Tax=Gigaspora rosea TaxID=44941 RepID=A0A397V319_9GLOM|nr:hypothetical protein C2G38_2195516 [Gigaspora rosea]